MVDYSVDGTFDLHFTDNNDFVVVDGREEFEENLVIELDHQYNDVIGGYRSSDTIQEKIEVTAHRVAESFDVIDSISDIRVFEPIDDPETVVLEIIYSTGDTFEETL